MLKGKKPNWKWRIYHQGFKEMIWNDTRITFRLKNWQTLENADMIE